MTDAILRRFDRLRSVLPAIYDTRPGNALEPRRDSESATENVVKGASNLGILLARVASELARLDEAQRRTLHDRWLPLALGDGNPAPLDRLAALLDVSRLRGPGVNEDSEAFRSRVGITARSFSGGLGTPRTLLSLALAAIGTEPCPHMRMRYTDTTKGAPWAVESTTARGMPLGTRRRCDACRSGRTGNDTNNGPTGCPKEADVPLAEAFLLENPVTASTFRIAARYGQAFPLESRSLTTDRPVVRLEPTGAEALTNPAVQNRATGEMVLFHGSVQKGQTLVLYSAMAHEELAPFDSLDQETHHRWARRDDKGQRASVGKAELQSSVSVEDVSNQVYFLSGSRFDDLTSTYAGPPSIDPNGEAGIRFAEMARIVRTPRLRPGSDPWRLLEFSQQVAVGADPLGGVASGAKAAADVKAEAEAIKNVFKLLQDAEDHQSQASSAKPAAILKLEWWVRPPATVQLCLLRSAQVDKAMAMGAIERGRAGGVRDSRTAAAARRGGGVRPRTEGTGCRHLARGGGAGGQGADHRPGRRHGPRDARCR